MRCLCDAVPRVENHTQLLLYQHRREARHAFGSVPFLRSALSRLTLHQVDDFVCRPPPDAVGWVLLYPTQHARSLDAMPEAQRPTRLVVLDGTWWQAKKMLASSPWLASLPAVTIAALEPSRYLIRREPTAAARSTLEAVVHALRLLEPTLAGLDGLLDVFDRMNQLQLDVRAGTPAQPRTRRARTKPSRTIPETLLRDAERIVVAYVELRSTVAHGVRRRTAVQLTATIPASGSTRCFALPDRLGEPTAAAQFCAEWQEWAPPRPLVVAWDVAQLAALAHLFPAPLDAIALKHIVANLSRQSPPILDEVVSTYALARDPAVTGDRAANRLASTQAILRHLQEEDGKRMRSHKARGKLVQARGGAIDLGA